MTVYNHTDIGYHALVDSDVVNAPLGQLDAAMGDRSTLQTSVKTTLVAAINEIHSEVATSPSTTGTTWNSWTINSDLSDANIDLIFGRTTGGNGTIRWDGGNLRFFPDDTYHVSIDAGGGMILSALTDSHVIHTAVTGSRDQGILPLVLRASTEDVAYATDGFGPGIWAQATGYAGGYLNQGKIQFYWVTNSPARGSGLQLSVYQDNTLIPGVTIENDGTGNTVFLNDDVEILGSLTLNSDQGDNDVVLTFDRTTGGAATLTWDGTDLTVDQNVVVDYVGVSAYSLSIRASSGAVQNTVANNLLLEGYTSHASHGTDGQGASLIFKGEASDGNSAYTTYITSYLADATNKYGGCKWYVSYQGSDPVFMQAEYNGAAAEVGFLGAAPSAQIAHVADASVAYTTGDLDTEAEIIDAINATNGKINSILATLEAFGFHATS